MVDLDDRTEGILAVDVKYYEWFAEHTTAALRDRYLP
jgi:hypothetical protein